ncbi:hypothetical protein KIN20_006835 [Parelaphostrongylus tenuis]|uniref:Uncharacterized protein n=1 Tax=Parelaphostrongylus tenuis TaxID=148309 RepID=A0AAD5M5H6_PARTN|nr:hypothetical protein KIN20_006835 [Parelaphostrongylus tenuis]
MEKEILNADRKIIYDGYVMSRRYTMGKQMMSSALEEEEALLNCSVKETPLLT